MADHIHEPGHFCGSNCPGYRPYNPLVTEANSLQHLRDHVALAKRDFALIVETSMSAMRYSGGRPLQTLDTRVVLENLDRALEALERMAARSLADAEAGC